MSAIGVPWRELVRRVLCLDGAGGKMLSSVSETGTKSPTSRIS
jgi:hypothetical protein